MAASTMVGTAAIQASLWSPRADDWVRIQEGQVADAYRVAFDALAIGPSTRLLDVGCGAGMALELAAGRGARVSGLDATGALLAHARERVPDAVLVEGEMEALPFQDASFDVVTGFNSFQYAARPVVAVGEARRVVVPGGRVLFLNWAPAERCDASGFLQRVGRLLPPAPPGAPGPFALSDEGALGALFADAGLDVQVIADVPCRWTSPDEETAFAGLICSGPVVRAIETSGEEPVRAAAREFLAPFATGDGGYALDNVFRYAIGTPRPSSGVTRRPGS
jgi:SAM-dependent methyltransferase